MNEKKLNLKSFDEVNDMTIDELETYIENIKRITNERITKMKQFRNMMTRSAKKLFLDYLNDVLVLYEYLFWLQHVLINKLTWKDD